MQVCSRLTLKILNSLLSTHFKIDYYRLAKTADQQQQKHRKLNDRHNLFRYESKTLEQNTTKIRKIKITRNLQRRKFAFSDYVNSLLKSRNYKVVETLVSINIHLK